MYDVKKYITSKNAYIISISHANDLRAIAILFFPDCLKNALKEHSKRQPQVTESSEKLMFQCSGASTPAPQ